MERLTKRYIIKSLDNIDVSLPIRYARYYINDNLRIQNKNGILEKEILDDNNVVISKDKISETEFIELKDKAYQKIIRNSYLYKPDARVSIKEYLENYEGLYRVEVSFSSKEEMNSYIKESWMGSDITLSNLAFDKYLSKLNKKEFLEELQKYL